MKTETEQAQWEVAFDETIQMWVVFFNQDRPDSLGERDFETGEKLSPIMCDQIEIGRYHTEAISRLIASAPEFKSVAIEKEAAKERVKELEEGLLIYINADVHSPTETSILSHEQQHRINIIALPILNPQP